MAVEILNPMVIDGTAREMPEVVAPPSEPSEPPFLIPAGRRFIALVWPEEGDEVAITVRGIHHTFAHEALDRAGLIILDRGREADAAQASPESS